MSKAYVMTGLSGAGKTTFGKKFAKENNLRYLNIDNFYTAVFGNGSNHTHKFTIWEMFYKAVDIAVFDGVDVLLDVNSPNRTDRNILAHALGPKYDVKCLIFIDTPTSLCISNNLSRDRVIPPDDMEKIIKSYQAPTIEEKDVWTNIYHIKNNANSFSDMEEM